MAAVGILSLSSPPPPMARLGSHLAKNVGLPMAVQSETTVQPTHPLGEKRRPYWGQILRNPQIPIVVVCLICFVAPAIMVVTGAFRTTPFGGGEWSAEMVWSVLQSPSMHSALWTTVSMGLVTVIISTVLAITFAAITTRTNTPLRGLLPLIMALVVATPSLFYAISWARSEERRVGEELRGGWGA